MQAVAAAFAQGYALGPRKPLLACLPKTGRRGAPVPAEAMALARAARLEPSGTGSRSRRTPREPSSSSTLWRSCGSTASCSG